MEVTPRQLYERLVEVTGARTDEDLARRLDIPLRSLTRIKAGKGTEFDRTIEPLALAGWLKVDGNGQPNVERARRLAGRLADDLSELADALGAP